MQSRPDGRELPSQPYLFLPARISERLGPARNGGAVFYKYKLHDADGNDLGEAHHAVPIKPGETILIGAGQKMRVLNVIAIEDDESPYVSC